MRLLNAENAELDGNARMRKFSRNIFLQKENLMNDNILIQYTNGFWTLSIIEQDGSKREIMRGWLNDVVTAASTLMYQTEKEM